MFAFVLRSHNVTQVEHSRMKRSLSSTMARIWEGFKFRLESPSVYWVKRVGGSKLGASIGVIVRNLLDIVISKCFHIHKYHHRSIVSTDTFMRIAMTSHGKNILIKNNKK